MDKRTQSKEKPFHICDICDKAFARSSYLIPHKRIYTGEGLLSMISVTKHFEDQVP